MSSGWTRGDPTTLNDLSPGSLFMTTDGTWAVKTEYRYPNGQCECALLASGEYAHFADGDATLVWPIQIHEKVPVDPLWEALEILRVQWTTDDPGEPYKWEITSYPDGWRADIVWDHHDGPIHCWGAPGATPQDAIRETLAQYSQRHDHDDP